jgi:hypothetical protein
MTLYRQINYTLPRFEKMRDAPSRTGNDILYSLRNWDYDQVKLDKRGGG